MSAPELVSRFREAKSGRKHEPVGFVWPEELSKLLLQQPLFLRQGDKPEPQRWNRIQLRVSDLGAAEQQARAQGVRVRGERIRGNGGDQLLIEDPSGNLVELFEPRREAIRERGGPAVAPFFAVDDVAGLLAFVERVFEGTAHTVMRSDDGVLRHATVRVGEGTLMLSSGTDLYGQHELRDERCAKRIPAWRVFAVSIWREGFHRRWELGRRHERPWRAHGALLRHLQTLTPLAEAIPVSSNPEP